ncbi:MAG: 7-cyano-7-deazaguanine synthase QueC [Phycisphaerae bacterium]|nr:7-cyano-7-deazaguanine synthase QueC [Phycisphaerae bacterium]
MVRAGGRGGEGGRRFGNTTSPRAFARVSAARALRHASRRPDLPFPVPAPIRAVVLLSGGLDSAVTLACARADPDGPRACHALSFDYGQRHRSELRAAARVAEHLGAAEHRVVAIDLRAIGGSALTGELAVPKRRADEPDPSGPARIPVTYVPARNLTFLSIAAGWAEVLGAPEIWLGVNAVDYSGYPDCRPDFIHAFERVLAVGTRAGVEGRALRVRTPLLHWSKARIIREGAARGVDFSLTRSCYDPDEAGRACGACESCVLRARGFDEAGVIDPTPYSADATRPARRGAP